MKRYTRAREAGPLFAAIFPVVIIATAIILNVALKPDPFTSRETLSNHRTQANAIGAGRREAQRDRVDLVTHGRDGTIRSKDSFGNDPIPPRDREH